MPRVLNESEELDEGLFIDFEITYTMLECRGCGSITLRRCVVCVDVGVNDLEYYPPPISRQTPRWRYDLPG
jgi:hypothetical protein